MTTSRMQVLWNGEFTEEFAPSCGVMQGDPMSPYLFVLTMERLGHEIRGAVENGDWRPICRGRGRPPLFTYFLLMILCCLVKQLWRMRQ